MSKNLFTIHDSQFTNDKWRLTLFVLPFAFCFLLFTSSMAQVQIGGDSVTFGYDQPKEYVIGGITISGTRYLDESVLVNLSGLIVGDTIQIPGDKISKAIQSLWKQGLFSDVKVAVVKVQGKTAFLDLQLMEKPRLSKFTFKGVSKGEAEKIREKIKLERDKVITENVLTTTRVRDLLTECRLDSAKSERFLIRMCDSEAKVKGRSCRRSC